MKRSKYEDKAIGPMFPRLHVNDTERGGPRAPPRNKMALYEQLTIPSNRHNQGNMYLIPNSGVSQGTSNERLVYFPSYQHPVTHPLPSHSADRLQRQPSDAVNSSFVSHADQRRPEDEDDFAVPIFSHSGRQQSTNAHQSRNDEERCRTFSSSCSFRLPNACNIETDEVDSDNLGLRQGREDQDGEQITTVILSSSDPTVKYSATISARETSDGVMQLEEDAVMSDHLDMDKTSRLNYANVERRYNDSCGPIKEAEGGISSRLKANSPFRPSNRNEICREDEENQRDNSLLRDFMDRVNSVSRNSNVATISELDVSPDSVVDIIGLKHFWKARKAIVNQQRVFAVQVFELHRLIKVQQLIAESPEVLIDATAFLGKSSIKVTHLKHSSAQYTLKALTESNKPKDKPKDNSQNPIHIDDKTEGSSENAVAKPPTPPPPSPTPTQPLNHPQFPANPALQIPPPMAIPQPGGHQWLVPVMSPSEGLIYKPYPGTAFPNPVCGGCGPHGTGPTPLPSHHFMNPNYGVPPSPYYHHPGYFPPYGMSVMNSAASASAVDQINQQSGSNLNGETGQTDIRMPNFSVQQQGSCTKPSQRHHSELLGSTGSSPSGRAQEIVRPVPNRKEKDACMLFQSRAPPPRPRGTEQPTKPQNARSPPHPRETEQPTTLVKAVPNNARSYQTRETEQPSTLIKAGPSNAKSHQQRETEQPSIIFKAVPNNPRPYQTRETEQPTALVKAVPSNAKSYQQWETGQPATLVKAVPNNPRSYQTRETEQPTTLVKAVPNNPSSYQTRETEQPTTLVKVVPHNARTASESAARIFRSIQEERRQNQPNQ